MLFQLFFYQTLKFYYSTIKIFEFTLILIYSLFFKRIQVDLHVDNKCKFIEIK